MSTVQTPLEIAEAVIQLTVKLADAADVYVKSGTRLVMRLRNGEIEELQQSQTLGLALRLMANRRTVLVHSTDPSSVALRKLVEQAVAMTGSLPEPKEPARFAAVQDVPVLPHPDPDLRHEPIAVKRDRLIAVERSMLAVAGVTAASITGCEENDGEVVLMNTRGLRLYSPYARIDVSTECVAERGAESASGGYHVAVPSRSQLPPGDEIGRLAGLHAVRLLGARPIASEHAPVIFTPESGWAPLVRMIPALRGDFVCQSRSLLGEKLGHKVASPLVTIRDNALLATGASRCAFDGEGSPATNLVVVQNGLLRSFLTDISSAETLGVACTGNTHRGSYDQAPQIGTTNFYLEPGDSTPEEIIRATDRGLMVTQLSGWWVGMSPTNPVFSSAAMGLWIEKGEIAYPVRGISIGGNLLDMLDSIDRVGNDLSIRDDTSVPTYRVADMAISGL